MNTAKRSWSAGPKFELVHTNMLGEEDMVMASPAITGGRVFLRTDRRLYCLENALTVDCPADAVTRATARPLAVRTMQPRRDSLPGPNA